MEKTQVSQLHPIPPNTHSLKHKKHTCFLNLNTLNLSKSLNSRLLLLFSLLCAHELADHLPSTSAAFQDFLMEPVPAARGTLGITMSVRVTWVREAEWRGTARELLSEGPSTRICTEGMLG